MSVNTIVGNPLESIETVITSPIALVKPGTAPFNKAGSTGVIDLAVGTTSSSLCQVAAPEGTRKVDVKTKKTVNITAFIRFMGPS